MPILVTGGTGHVGGEVVRQLARARDQSQGDGARLVESEFHSREGVEIVRGDLSDPKSLDAVLIDMNNVLLSSPAGPDMEELQGNMIDAAKRAGIRHLVKISVMGADPNSPIAVCRWHAQVERHLAESEIPFTNLRPNSFMQNMLRFADAIARKRVFHGAMRDGKASFVDVRDIAAVAIAVLTDENHRGESLTITGPEALSFSDVAEKLSAATGRKISYVNLPAAEFISQMIAARMPEWLARDMAAVQELFGKGYGATVTDVVHRVGRMKPTTFDQFARDFASVFRGEWVGSRFAACL